jgi:lipopolysaccharide export system permease protein
MGKLDLYVGWTFTRLFVLTTLAIPPLFMLGDLTDNVDDYLNRDNVGVVQVLEGYLYSFPQWIQYSLPIAGLVAAVFTVSGMTVHREVVAAKAGGVSFHRLFLPIAVVGVAITGVGLVMTDWVPQTNLRAAEALDENRLLRVQTFREDVAIRTESGMLLTARRVTGTAGTISEPQLTIDTPIDRIHIDASSARWDEEAGWVFSAGRLRRVQPSGLETSQSFLEMRVPSLTETPLDLVQVSREPEEMTTAEIERQIGIIERAGGDANELRVEIEHRAAIPLATLVIILFGTPLATTSKRGGAAFGVGIALGSTILYMLLMRVFSAMGTAGLIDPVTAAWAPNAIFFGLGVLFLVRVRT